MLARRAPSGVLFFPFPITLGPYGRQPGLEQKREKAGASAGVGSHVTDEQALFFLSSP